jgi:hypothetical protein
LSSAAAFARDLRMAVEVLRGQWVAANVGPHEMLADGGLVPHLERKMAAKRAAG